LAEKKVSKYLIKKKKDEPCRKVKGGPVDALIVYAAKYLQCSEDAKEKCEYFSEAFLTTFRTFIQPAEVIEKLVYRYERMAHQHLHNNANDSLRLLLRVVNELR
jgi:Rap guanine nucleotide exchange factor 1